jgi:hypothetical protein
MRVLCGDEADGYVGSGVVSDDVCCGRKPTVTGNPAITDTHIEDQGRASSQENT